MRRFEISVFGAPLEVLQKNMDLAPNPTFFLELELVELDVFGREFHEVGGVELFFLE